MNQIINGQRADRSARVLDGPGRYGLSLLQVSATEIIQQLKALPASEREVFARLFREMETAIVPPPENKDGVSGSNDWPDFGARLKQIYGDKVVVDSEAVISYARGEW
jgi:hypothetical protein